MAKIGSGKRKMTLQRKKEWNRTAKSLKSVGRAFKGGSHKKKGCYVATCVYGSYDCPQVWILRRFRDQSLEKTWLGRRFISLYYFVSPIIISLFGNSVLLKRHWRYLLDSMVMRLKDKGFLDTPYDD